MSITRIQSGSGSSGVSVPGVESFTALWGSTATIGNVLVVALASRVLPTDTNPPVVQLSKPGVIWNLIWRQVSDTAGGLAGVVLDVYYGFVIVPSASKTMIISYGTTPSVGCVVFAEYNGLRFPGVDKVSQNKGASASIIALPTAFTSQSEELWIASLSSENTQNEVLSASNGFSVVSSVSLSGIPGNKPAEPTVTLVEKISLTRGIASSTGTGLAADRFATITATIRSLQPDVLPTGDEPLPKESVTFNKNIAGEGLDRLLEQFKRGE